MFTELPLDIQERVFHALKVSDRARLCMSIPKSCAARLQRTGKQVAEKRLGVLAKAIRKKKLTTLTRTIRAFLKDNVNQDDPTVAEMARDIPEVVRVVVGGVKAKLETISELEEFLDLVSHTKPEDASRVVEHPFFATDKSRVLFRCMQTNLPLLEAFIVHMSVPGVIQYVEDSIHCLTYKLKVLKFLMRFATLSHAKLDMLYTDAMGNMDVDTVEFIEKLMVADS